MNWIFCSILYFTSKYRRNDRTHHCISWCPVSGCTVTFESSTKLESHIAADVHDIQQTERRTTNDVARIHLTEIIRTTTISVQEQTQTMLQGQTVPHVDLTQSAWYQSFSSAGRALHILKHTNPMYNNVKNFIDKVRLDFQEAGSKLTAQQMQQQIRTKKTPMEPKFLKLMSIQH